MLTLGCTENSRYDTRPVWHRFAKLFTLQLVELSLESWVCLQKSVSAIADVCNFECVCRQTDYLCDFWVTLITCNYCIYCQVGRIVDVLKDKRSHHNGFPVVDCLDSNDKEVNFLCFFFLWFHEIGRSGMVYVKLTLSFLAILDTITPTPKNSTAWKRCKISDRITLFRQISPRRSVFQSQLRQQ